MDIHSYWIHISSYIWISNYLFQRISTNGRATGKTPFWAHQWRILMEGLALTFGLLSLEISKKWFVWTSLIWSVILGILNVYQVITAIIYEASNI